MRALTSRITTVLVRRAITLISLIAVCIACSTSKSAVPQPQLTENRSLSQSPTPVTSSSLQETVPCTLKLPEAPPLNGLKLGMTPEQVLALFPGSKDEPELRSALSTSPGRFGNSSFLITPSKYASAEQYKGISRFTFSFLDGHVSNFTISYNGPEWPDIDKFIENFVEGKHLPPADQWAPYEGVNQMKTLTCNGFSIQIFAGGEGGSSNYVLVEDLEADKKLKERRKKARQQASPQPAATPTPSR